MSRLDDLKAREAMLTKRIEQARELRGKAKHLKPPANSHLWQYVEKLITETEDYIAEAIEIREGIRKKINDLQPHDHRPSVMYDSVTVGAIPADAKAVGCYVGPSRFTCDAAGKQAPDARKVKISQAGSSTTPADVVDVEPGDATNDTGTQWLKRKLGGEALGGNAGKVPKVYTAAGNAQAFIDLAKARGVDRSRYRLWSAHIGRGEHVCGPDTCGFPRADGTQWTFTALGRNLDQSRLEPSFWD